MKLYLILKRITFRNFVLTHMIGVSLLLLSGQMNVFASQGMSVPDTQQSRTVQGTVTDDSGESIPGVNVVVKGTTTGVITDSDGRFTINVPSADAVLVFSYIGYVSKEILVGGMQNINVTISEDTRQLEEVIVVGYGTQKKVNMSGAVESVSSKVFESRSARNASLSLQGIVPNLYITPGSGQADNTPSFNIRGTTSINGGSPLILVDGVPTSTTDFSRISMHDIENISILKDAASAAIYGARASYGVILVTTKKGEGKMTVQFNNSFSIKQITRRPELVSDLYTHAYLRNYMGQPWQYLYSDEQLEYAQRRSEDPSLPGVIIDTRNPALWVHLDFTDYYEEVYSKTASVETHNISFSGSSDKASYYLGGEFFQERGMMNFNKDIMNRYNMRSRVDFKPTSWLTFGNNTALTYSHWNTPSRGPDMIFMYLTANNLQPVRNPDGSFTNEGARNVGAVQYGGIVTNKRPVIYTQFTADFELIKDVLNIKSDYTAKFTTEKFDRWETDRTLPFRTGPDRPYNYIGWAPLVRATHALTTFNMFNLYADFRKDFGKHNVSAVGGFSQESENYEYVYAQRTQMITESYPSLQLSTGDMTINESKSSWALRSAFYRLTYSYDQKYIIETNGRYDGSSRFPRKDRFGFFPSVSAAWTISRESFFEPLTSWVSFAKIRGSYGSLGNQALSSAYPYISTMSAGTVNVMLDGSRPMGVNPPGIVSGSMTWEKVNTLNGGVDINFFKNRLAITADIYKRQTIGMLTKGRTLPDVLGTSEPQINAADLETKGWEISVLWRDKIYLAQQPFDYNVRFVLSNYRAYITKYDNPTKSLSDYYEGQRIGEIWGMETLGFFKDQADIDSHADQTLVASNIGLTPIQAGDLKFKDLNNDGVISRGDWTVDNPGDNYIIGNNTLQFPYGVDMNASWNGFDLRIFLQGVGKRDFSPSGQFIPFSGIYITSYYAPLETHLDHWTPENPEAYFPRLKPRSCLANRELGAAQTRYLQNAAYMRLKNLTFGYSLPARLASKIKMDNIRLYFSGENLWEKHNMPHLQLDPEILSDQAPLHRIYSVGLNITF